MGKRLAVILVASLGLLGLGATPVQAAIPPCPTSYDALCIYEHNLGPDPYRYVIVDSYPRGFCFNLPADWDNRATAYENNTDHYVTFYTDNYCNTDGLLPRHIPPNSSYRRFDTWDEREANSVRFE